MLSMWRQALPLAAAVVLPRRSSSSCRASVRALEAEQGPDVHCTACCACATCIAIAGAAGRAESLPWQGSCAEALRMHLLAQQLLGLQAG